LVIFGAFSWLFLAVDLRPPLGDFVGDVCMNPLWFFSLWSPSQIHRKRCSTLGFLGFGKVVFLLGFSSDELLSACGFGLWCSWSVLGRFQGVLLGFVKVLLSLQF
jgi:hypothetical protein